MNIIKKSAEGYIFNSALYNFRADYRNLGLITYLKEMGASYQHFEVPLSEYMGAAHFYRGRIIHYINSDLNSARAKFGFREEFVEKIFDANLASQEYKDRYKLWEKNWTEPEEMPSQAYYYNMWNAVQDCFLIYVSLFLLQFNSKKS